ncbi:hypothetical protein GALMADRAFT_242958 [Galerina marginata CBS 339.88]|uniref:UBX domain-containing protein n=1 Tax=Galerina marginata (strain CBS 339.88) TaxID=685588 RepID=A0A067T7D1_GALM3|nr:hypothetical protein GALMADRAFT_242958 [Galerina marginata CBS 339.88]
MDSLDDEQRRALGQLREITNGADDEVAVSVLDSVGWDVQRAAELIFGTSAIPPPSTSIETFDIDDSQQGEPVRQRHTPSSSALTRPLFSFLAFPFHVISSLFRFIFGILRIPIPQFRFMGLNFYRPLRPRPTSRGGPDRWLRDLEEETGAISIGRSKAPRGTTSSLNIDAGQSSLTSRLPSANGQTEDGRKYLPDFTISTYEDMLRMCQREAKIGCVILVSDEHDDVPEFKRSTLTDPIFVKTLFDNDIIVWGGDVRDRDPWSAAEKLQATTYPFVAFLALQPRRGPMSSSSSSSTSPPSLTVLSRHQGKSIPASSPTSAQSLVDHLEQQLLPRVKPFLDSITAEQRERERDRHIREEQDRAFQNTARRDKERIEGKIAAERAEREARRMAEAEAHLAEQRRAREAELARQRENDRMDWRRWTRRAIVNAQPMRSVTSSLRIAIRLPNGARVVHSFPQSASLTTLYAFVDSQFIPPQILASDDPVSLPGLKGVGESALESHISTHQDQYWGFRVASAYPRVEIPWKPAAKLSDVDQLKGGGQVVVELVQGGRSAAIQQDGEDDDGYHTEDSE